MCPATQLNGIVGAYSNRKGPEVGLAWGGFPDRQERSPLESPPKAERRCRKGRKRRAAVTVIEVGVRAYEPLHPADGGLDAAVFHDKVVLEPSRHPDARKPLKKDDAQALVLHGSPIYRPNQVAKSAATQEGL